jgi:hypothetical protein
LKTQLSICPFSGGDVQFVFRTLPGGADLAASPAYYAFMDGRDPDHPVPFTDTRPKEFGGIPGADYARLRAEELANKTTPSNLTTAEAFHSDDLQWLANLSSSVTAKISLVAGTSQCTVGQIRKVSELVTGRSPGRVDTFDYQQVDGDGTVVRQSAALTDPATGQNAAGRATVYYRPFNHAQLVQNGKGLNLALALINDVTGIDPGAPQPARNCEILSVHSPMKVMVTDASGNHTGTTGTGAVEDIPGSRYEEFGDMKLIMLPTSGTYTASFSGTGTGQATVRLRRVVSGTLDQTTTYLNIPTSASATASLSFDAGQGTSGSLSDNVNGDGSNIITISPNPLTGPAASDTTPPAITGVAPADGTNILQGGPSGLTPVSVSWNATDAESGIDTSFAIIDGDNAAQSLQLSAPQVIELEAGTHTLDVFTTDKAGNLAHIRTSFTIQSCGDQVPQPVCPA